MTAISMPDCVDVSRLPDGFPAYLGYVDGTWPTAKELAKAFPGKRYVLLTVTGATLAADGCDIEERDLTVSDGARWARQKLNREPLSRPVLYSSVTKMEDILTALAAWKISRDQVRLLSAHWGAGRHICGPRSCGRVSVYMDGTQWTNMYPGRDGQGLVDMSVLADGFFGSWTEELVRDLPVVRQGDSGPQVRTVQGLCAARNAGPDGLAIDGIFGPQTKEAVTAAQQRAHITADGIVGPQTWPVLLGIA